jgi:hypothetical protein
LRLQSRRNGNRRDWYLRCTQPGDPQTPSSRCRDRCWQYRQRGSLHRARRMDVMSSEFRSELFQAILVANLHIKRFDSRICWRVRRIFEPKNAQLFLSAIEDSQAVIQEYYQHEAGHALGMGIDIKDRMKLFTSPQQSGLEEYKTDIGGWRLAEAAFDPEAVGKLIACTLLIRWGIDFARPGAPTQDGVFCINPRKGGF